MYLFVPHESKYVRLAWNVRWLVSTLPTVPLIGYSQRMKLLCAFPVNEAVLVLGDHNGSSIKEHISVGPSQFC